MDLSCEYCGVVRAVVYCKSDSARLCLHCDGCVHSANSSTLRHSRSLLCDKCNSQPAMIRCMNHKLSLCQGCDWNPNDCSALGHRRIALNCYTGCFSLAKFSRIWSFVFDANSSLGGLESVGTLPKSENCTSQRLEQTDHNGGYFGLVNDKLDEIESCVRYEPWMRQSQIIPSNPNYTPYCKDEAFFFPQDSIQPKGMCQRIADGLQHMIDTQQVTPCIDAYSSTQHLLKLARSVTEHGNVFVRSSRLRETTRRRVRGRH